MAIRTPTDESARVTLSERMARVVEEVCPFPYYFLRCRKTKSQAYSDDLGAVDGPYQRYHQLSNEDLQTRLREERERAKALDEKTFNLTLALTVGLTVLGSTTNLLVSDVPFVQLRFPVSLFATLSIFYSLLGGFLALGALKTLPSFGYGTDFFIQVKGKRTVLVHSLAAQELMNIVRHLRNESAYQCLRNGSLCLLVSVALYTTSLTANVFLSKNVPKETDQTIAAKIPSSSAKTPLLPQAAH